MAQTARKLNVITQPVPQTKINPGLTKTYKTNPYVKKTRALVIKATLFLAILGIVSVTVNAKLAKTQLQLQQINQDISRIDNNNESKKQEISELSSRSRLNKIAKKAGLTMDEQKIRNVTK